MRHNDVITKKSRCLLQSFVHKDIAKQCADFAVAG